MDNILTIFNDLSKTPDTYMLQIAQREKVIRKKEKLSRAELSEKSNVSYGSLKRFEETGNISLASLIKIAIALDCIDEFENLFRTKKPESIEDIINGTD
jgi:transcriptional regulator with XRE-family HTH domain